MSDSSDFEVVSYQRSSVHSLLVAGRSVAKLTPRYAQVYEYLECDDGVLMGLCV